MATQSPTINYICNATGAKRCGSCLSSAYCSPACQKNYWSVYKTLCKDFRAMIPTHFNINCKPAFTFFFSSCFPSPFPEFPRQKHEIINSQKPQRNPSPRRRPSTWVYVDYFRCPDLHPSSSPPPTYQNSSP